MALVAELLDAQYRAFVTVHSRKKPAGKPLHIPRPGESEVERMTPGELMARRGDGEGR